MKPCNTCPFVKKHKLLGSPEWLIDVMKFVKKDKYFSHTCHKTDPKADGYKGAKKTTPCWGSETIQLNEICKTPGDHGVYESYQHLVSAYIIHWGIKK